MVNVIKQLQEFGYFSNRKLYISFCKLSVAYENINRYFLVLSVKKPLPRSKSIECFIQIEELYQPRKYYMSSVDSSTGTFETSPVVLGGDESTSLHYAHLKTQTWGGRYYLSIQYHDLNESANRRQLSWFSSRGHCTDDEQEWGYADRFL